MRRRFVLLAATCGGAAVLAACSGGGHARDAAPDAAWDRVLVYTRTLGYRHADAIDAIGPALGARLAADHVAIEQTEDPAALLDLSAYRAVIFAYTSGNDVLDAAAKASLEAYVRGGGGWLGIHSASDTEYAWPFYAELVIAHFASHPAIQPGRIVVEASEHPAMAPVPARWDASDEWYNFTVNPRGAAGVQILATIEESSYTGGTMGADHPMVWAHERLGGRALYTALGHAGERWAEPVFVDHVAGAVRWIIRRDAAP